MKRATPNRAGGRKPIPELDRKKTVQSQIEQKKINIFGSEEACKAFIYKQVTEHYEKSLENL